MYPRPSKKRLAGFLVADAVVGAVVLAFLAIAIVQGLFVFRVAIDRQEVLFGHELDAAKNSPIQSFF